MDYVSSTVDLVLCIILISFSVIGNLVLIYLTRRCIGEDSRTFFTLIVNLAFVHLIPNLVVNVLKSVYASGVLLDSVGCKVLTFSTTFSTSLAIWFTLYIVLFYCCKLCRVVHPPAEAAATDHWKCHLVLIVVLWFAAFAICCPLLFYTEKTVRVDIENGQNRTVQNRTEQQSRNLMYTDCKIEYKIYQVEFFYGKILLVAIDLLPLLIMFFAGFRIVHLLWEYRMGTYGDIWVGRNTAETEVLRACKLLLVLILLITSLWISHFTLMYCVKNFKSNYFAPPVLTILSSGYSAVSPYLLMLINYKVIVQVKCFCYKAERKELSLSTISSSVDVSPYA